jgi:hypothetical protein
MGCAARGRCPGGDRPGRCGAGRRRPCALSLAGVLGQLNGSRDLVIALAEGPRGAYVGSSLNAYRHDRLGTSAKRSTTSPAAVRVQHARDPPRRRRGLTRVCCAVPSAPCRAQPILASRPCLRAKTQVVNGVARIDAWLWHGRRRDRSYALQPCKALLPRSMDFLLTTVANMVTTSKTKSIQPIIIYDLI